MKLSEIASSTIPKVSDFTTSPKYKTLMHLPFFNSAYKTTKEQFDKLNNKGASFTAMFDINLKTAFMEFIDNGGNLSEALKIPRHDLPRHIAGQVEDKMTKDSAFMQDILKELGIEVVVDTNSNMVTIFDASDVKQPGHQSQLFVGDPGKKPRLPEQDWDNPTNDELERELQQADDFVLQRSFDKEQKKYDYEKIKKRFYAKHGPEKAERMLYAMKEKGAFG